ncbi:MAG: chemotaxis protein CheW [Bacillales bacterium]|jgi:purine-binding chemotaxis protein CheW|nr:chemotaxis protein CheW [Bacillales bacterium]
MTELFENEEKVIVFQLSDEEYAIPVSKVRSIEKLQHITRVPRTANFVKGVVNLRGLVTPIIDLRTRLNIEEVEYNESTRVIIVSHRDYEVGLIVDAANDVIDINLSAVEPPPDVVGVVEVEYIDGVVKLDKRLLIILNLDKALKYDKK